MNSSSNGTKLLLIAIDGLSFPLLERWSAQGDLPVFKRLMKDGCYGLLKPFTPSNSAVIWTSVMTGMHPKKHGIDSFIYYKVRERIIKKPTIKKVLKFGARPLFHLLRRGGYIQEIPFSLDLVQQKMLWEVFAQEERSVGVINWWHSWPAYKVPGFIISDRVHYWRLRERGKYDGALDTNLVYPDRLLAEVVKKVVDPFSLSFEVYSQFMKVDAKEIDNMKNCHFRRHQLMSEFKYLYSMDESVRRLALFCLKEFPKPDFMALYFRGIDIISHCALKYAPEDRDNQISDKEVEKYGETIRKYYRFMDGIINELIEAVSDNTTVMLVSDHGFEREPDGRFGHRRTRLPGLYIVCGQHIKKGIRIDNKSPYNIAPTLLYLGGLPVAREMDGVVLTECVDEALLQSHPISFVESYGVPLRHKVPAVSNSEEEIKERLRALGYID